MQSLNDEKIKWLTEKANEIRQSIIEMLIEAGSGHSAGPLGMADIFTALFFHIMKHDPTNPLWAERDRLILSNGHICPVLYATMAHSGYFPLEELKTLRKFGSRLQGHPHREYLPFIETSSGPLGLGLSQTVGMCLADRIDHGKYSNKQFYCLLSDGELEEGNTWEGVMLGGKERLQNITAIIDRNNIQIEGYTEDIMPLEPLADKWKAFNWHVQMIDGHNFDQIVGAVGEAQAVFDKPSIIIANTIPGKGVSFMERRWQWHGNPPGKGPEDVVPKERQGKEAIKELRTLGGKIKSEHE
ncbi:MAG: transketolase [Candidatus Zambryskibacteria bacterium RIFCSPLOWO2_01_FULL_39_39]|uniref:Transketolase n=1 Tax=Candidatus Zambryskibacteria bacterium RIFCSPLOWO2_01_FULL_39_39 TaxID=1802758 RepID=A0A1G2U1H6_9BACT|nr:MAG: Transketolase domain protein [Parcubacteria group bacterium GW2011_GWA1_38_7]OHA87188.1 MAG: transketolase [Candidatus Zambryskibacteria bacterium RIFCSPHIGHO2_01_FULL_39_63]OHA94826.1 MAG: transketolase [Candidatus Zambryskibacteria bacterium RIFCSPHIGHO2_02_FULL_39_19]OHA98316.1 MAG: transketolase [Candidatus Zambryskibacteria bacterium RIFCSPHIGHO2_12_FULL_39_21]OHB02702.1 MAG: transketolase [Candidatus Zambryskibacteria bacterium RIFCSPLOWO2_01_FULL_39_39]